MEKKHFIPTSKKEIDELGWDYIDIIIFTGDAYIDHPSFGTAVIARVLDISTSTLIIDLFYRTEII